MIYNCGHRQDLHGKVVACSRRRTCGGPCRTKIERIQDLSHVGDAKLLISERATDASSNWLGVLMWEWLSVVGIEWFKDVLLGVLVCRRMAHNSFSNLVMCVCAAMVVGSWFGGELDTFVWRMHLVAC